MRRPESRRKAALLALGGALALVAALSAPLATAAVKPRFWGLNLSFYENVPQGDGARLERVGLRTMRVSINWYAVQPNPLTTDWSKPDALFMRLAKLGIQPQPLIFGSPYWANGLTSPTGSPLEGQMHSTPPVGSASARAAWRSFVQAAVNRYKPGGTFWTAFGLEHPGVAPQPVRRWQIWNEPNIPAFFDPRPAPAKYARLVRIANNAIDAADPTAKLALAGILANARYSGPRFLRKLYAMGLKRDFDMVAVHPYGSDQTAVKRGIDRVRSTMNKAGDRRTPLWVSETSWSSARGGGSALDKGLAGQAQGLRRTYRMYLHNRRRWRLAEVSWFDLHDPTPAPTALCSWCEHAGLINQYGVTKPAWTSFRRFIARTG